MICVIVLVLVGWWLILWVGVGVFWMVLVSWLRLVIFILIILIGCIGFEFVGVFVKIMLLGISVIWWYRLVSW